tara:strand:+ start:476 stop:1339 length:864 start_codon:yes stop_codon:yes gene_type:complete
MNLENYIDNQKILINKKIENYLESLNIDNEILNLGMHYSILNGGKRIRPILCLAAAECFNGNLDNAMSAALAVEFFHCSTLVHDDLPSMDNDNIRRGKPTCHIKFGEANAILLGDALLIESFRILSSNNQIKHIEELANSAGANGVIAGQVADLLFENKKPSAKIVKYIHYNKTAILIRAALRMGALTADTEVKYLKKLSIYGEKIGLAFQIQDDILDEVSSSDKIGKTAKSDLKKSKMTYPFVYGIEKSKKIIKKLTLDANQELEKIPLDTKILEKISLYLLSRSN